MSIRNVLTVLLVPLVFYALVLYTVAVWDIDVLRRVFIDAPNEFWKRFNGGY